MATLKSYQETAISAKKIMQSTFKLDKQGTKQVMPVSLAMTKLGWKVRTVTKEPRKAARFHAVEVRLPLRYEGKFNSCNEVKVGCDCQRYLFVWNYALNKHDAAIKDRTNGDPPVITNPSESPGICIDGNAWIYTKRGSTRLKNIRVGDKVRTIEGYRKVTAKADMGIKKTLMIKTGGGRTLSLTPDHVVYAATPQGIKWMRADELTTNSLLICGIGRKTISDYIELPQPTIISGGAAILPNKVPKFLTEDVAELLGLFVAEGSGGLHRCGISQVEPITKLRLINLARKIFDRHNKDPLELGSYVSKLFRSWGVVYGSYDMRVPDIIFNSGNSVVAAFLKGYYAGDGWFSKDGRFSTAGTASKKLAHDLLLLLSRIGVNARITKNCNSGVNHITIWLVRTSDFANTSRAAKLFLPDRCDIDVVDNVDQGMYSFIPVKLVNAAIQEFCYELVDSRPTEDTLVRIRDIKHLFPNVALSDKLRAKGAIRQIRDRAGGKLTHYTTIKDAMIALRDVLARNLFRLYRIRRCGAFVNRSKVLNKISQMPDGGIALKKKLALLLDKSLFLEEISYIKRGKDLRVYDISVEGAEHFFANSICVHNCKHGLIALSALTKLNPAWPENRVTKGPGAGRVVKLATMRNVL